jgi:hypothetical protein
MYTIRNFINKIIESTVPEPFNTGSGINNKKISGENVKTNGIKKYFEYMSSFPNSKESFTKNNDKKGLVSKKSIGHFSYSKKWNDTLTSNSSYSTSSSDEYTSDSHSTLDDEPANLGLQKQSLPLKSYNDDENDSNRSDDNDNSGSSSSTSDEEEDVGKKTGYKNRVWSHICHISSNE